MVLNVVFLVLSLLSGLSFIILLLTSSEFESYITPLDKKEFMMPEIYGVGFKIIKIFNFEFKSRQANKIRENIVILYGERYAEYYLRVMYAQKISIIYMCVAVGCAVCALIDGTDKLLILGVIVIMCVALNFSFNSMPETKVKERSEKFMNEFPNAVSTIALLVNSGMVLREAWREVSMSQDSELYMEMRKVTEDMSSGIAEIDALYAFSTRCATPDIKKFTAMVVQGLEKGSRDLAYALQNQNNELWQAKKQNVIRKGELASSKLMIPLLIMFIGVLIMVIGPIMTNLGI